MRANLMQSRHLVCGLLLVAVLGASLLPLHAQSLRPDGAFYLKPRLGVNAYDGDRANGLSGPGPSTGLEAGYAKRLGPLSGSLGLYFLAGRYPAVSSNAPGARVIEPGELEMWRHTLGLAGQLGFLPERRLSPYVQLGAGTTVGVVGNALKAGFSPFGSVGLDYALTDQVGLFTEFAAIVSLPDGRLDAASGLDDRPADWFSFFGGGVRIGLNRAFTPVRVLTVDGPTRLEAGETATFTATANEDEATGPVEYEWRFGDGATGQGKTVTHRFDTPGNYTLTLTGRNDGSADEQLLTVAVTAPEAPATASAEENRSPQVVRFDGTAANDTAASDDEAPAAEAPAPEAAQPSTASVACSDIVDFNAAYFEEGAATFTAEGLQALRENAEVLKQCPSTEVRLEAYVREGEAGDAALAQARAQAVEQFYLENGTAPRRIRTASVLATDPGTIKQMGGLEALRRVDTVPAEAAPARPASSTAPTAARDR